MSYARCGAIPLLASSVVFGMLHSRILAATVAGLIYGLVARRRSALSDAVAAHALTNALLAVTVLATGRFDLW